MADIIQLKNGNYKGVDILFTESSTTGGNRLIKFNYPNSDNQSIERQGVITKSYSLTLWIPHENYYQEKDNLLRVLDDGVKGVFVHPTVGEINNVINGSYTLVERHSELGRASIDVVFEIDDGDGIPVQSGNLVSQVQEQSNLLNDVLNNDLAETFNVELSNSGNYSDAIESLNNIADSFDTAVNLVTPIIDVSTDVFTAIDGFRSNIADSISNPSNLATRISGIFTLIDNLSDAPSDIITVLKSLFNYGNTDPEIITTTAARIERKQNRDILRTNMRTQALSYAYVNYALQEYSNTNDLDAAQDTLENQYIDIRSNENISNEALEQLDRLRVQGQKTLDTARVSTKSVITVTTKPMPLTVFVFSYYGNTDLVDTIASLNNIKQNALISGDIKVLSGD